ncbi:MAG TPA: LPS-assembly protein LptD [Burkholderiales bacterium]|nr:LPS-assembly protein LptD [Burkholderiales bacterium]
MQRIPARELARRVAGCAALLIAGATAAQTPAPEDPATLDAQSIEGIAGLEVTARGSVEFRQGEFSVFADYLRFNREFGRLEADGGVRLQQAGDRFFGPSLRYDTAKHAGALEQPSFLIRRELTARGGAERIEFLGRDRYRLTGAHFTTCEPGHDDWMLEARELELDYETEDAVARGARLRFLGTTILGSPYFSLPLNNRRRSGLLAPQYAQTSNRGAEFEVPFYWNIAPEQDATITPTYMSKRGEQLKAQYRYLGRSFLGQARVEYLPEDKVLGVSRTGYSLQHEQRFTPSLLGRLDVNHVSDDQYFVDLYSQVRQVTTGNLQRDGYLQYGRDFGGTGIAAQARVQRFQTLQDPLAPIVPPYHRVPQVNLSATRNDMAGTFDGALPLEYTQFTHPTLAEGERSLVAPVLSAPLGGPGYFFKPKLGGRHARYQMSRADPGQPERQTVSVPWLSLDSGLVFERDTEWAGSRVVQTLEPRLFYVYAPFRDQSRLPLFDTALADFNYAQLFSENRFVGGDRFGDANQITWALTSRLVSERGVEGMRATVGQRYYFADERVGLTSASALRTATESDWLASIGGRLAAHWIADATLQYNARDSRTERLGVLLRYSPEIAKVLNVSYRLNRADELRQVDVSGQWPVSAGWYAVGRYNYSLEDQRVLEALAGVEYNGGCWVFRTVMQRVQAATDVTSKAIYFQLEFNGFGQIGSNETVNLFRRNVPGYSVTNPSDRALVPPSLGAAPMGAEGN